MAAFSLGKHPYVELCDLLKLEGRSENGVQAKIVTTEDQVKIDDAVEARKRCKIVAGQTVSSADHIVQVVARFPSWLVSTGWFSFQALALYTPFVHADNISISPRRPSYQPLLRTSLLPYALI